MMVSVPTAAMVQSWLNGQKDCPSRQHLLQNHSGPAHRAG